VDVGLANEGINFIGAWFSMKHWTVLLAATHKALPQRKVHSVQRRIRALRQKAATQHQTDGGDNGFGVAGSQQATQNCETGGHGLLYDGLSESDIAHLRNIQDVVSSKGGETNPSLQMC